MSKKKDFVFFDDDTPVHWQVDLYVALCGSGWTQTTGDASAITCEKCRACMGVIAAAVERARPTDNMEPDRNE